jgi:hypothetical protein
MDWTPEAIEALRGYWAEGHSTAEIGRRMGISKGTSPEPAAATQSDPS